MSRYKSALCLIEFDYTNPPLHVAPETSTVLQLPFLASCDTLHRTPRPRQEPYTLSSSEEAPRVHVAYQAALRVTAAGLNLPTPDSARVQLLPQQGPVGCGISNTPRAKNPPCKYDRSAGCSLAKNMPSSQADRSQWPEQCLPAASANSFVNLELGNQLQVEAPP